MAEPGFLYKATDAAVAEGVVGQRCAEWERLPDPPTYPSTGGGNDMPPETRPPGEDTGTGGCPAMRTVYVWQERGGGLSRIQGCYAITSPVDSTIGGWPASCGGGIYLVEDSKCGR